MEHGHEGAGPAFEGDRAPRLHDTGTAARVRRSTLDFLGRHHTGG